MYMFIQAFKLVRLFAYSSIIMFGFTGPLYYVVRVLLPTGCDPLFFRFPSSFPLLPPSSSFVSLRLCGALSVWAAQGLPLRAPGTLSEDRDPELKLSLG